MSVIQLLQLYHGPTKQIDRKHLKTYGDSCSSPGAEETDNIYSIFRLSNRLHVCLFVCCLNHFGNCSLCSISSNCIEISTHSGGSVLLV